MNNYAKIVVPGSPITKSNFKLHNKDGRAILPSNTGMAHDKFALYEEQIAYYARIQNPDTIFTESLIAILKVYYKSEKRHPDTANITKSIFDGIEKSGLIVNDAQITRILTEEFYDKENPRFELEFYVESEFQIDYKIVKKEIVSEKKVYSSLKKNKLIKSFKEETKTKSELQNKNIKENSSDYRICEFCNKNIKKSELLSANGGNTLICRPCFIRMY